MGCIERLRELNKALETRELTIEEQKVIIEAKARVYELARENERIIEKWENLN